MTKVAAEVKKRLFFFLNTLSSYVSYKYGGREMFVIASLWPSSHQKVQSSPQHFEGDPQGILYPRDGFFAQSNL